MSVLRLLFVFFRIGLLNELQYRANFLLQLFKTGFNFAWSITAVAVVFSHTDDLNGWQPAEIVALLGVFVLMGGLIGVVIQPSMEKFIEDVREGTLDFTLTKPEDAQVLVSVGQVRVWRLLDVVAGPVIIAAALYHLGRGAGPEAAVKFGIALSAGSLIMYSFWVILATISFLVHPHREHTDDFPGHVRRGALAGHHLPGVAAGGADLPRPGDLRGHGACPGLGGAPDRGLPDRHGGACPGLARRLPAVLEESGCATIPALLREGGPLPRPLRGAGIPPGSPPGSPPGAIA